MKELQGDGGLRLGRARDEIKVEKWPLGLLEAVGDLGEADDRISGNKRRQLIRPCFEFWGHYCSTRFEYM